MKDEQTLGQALDLPCGARLANRLMKSAMSEILADPGHRPGQALCRVYRTFAEGGVGLCLTGNVMVDSRYLGEPRNVVLEDDSSLDLFARWAQAGTMGGTHFWMQLNHPGRQSPSFLSPETVAPSATPFESGLRHVFPVPRAMSEAEILETIERFGRSAGWAKAAGFTGVQIHGAHGYLVSQFLSPQVNRRQDDWGGPLENRARFCLELVRSIRAQVGAQFPVSIKINSADFEKGGFSQEDALAVIGMLVDAGIDLIEISGGSYERPVMTGQGLREPTRRREAYFLEFAELVRAKHSVPLAVTGGFRTAQGMAAAVASGAIDIVGLARPLAIEPDLPKRILAGEDFVSKVRSISTGLQLVDRYTMLSISWYENQLAFLGQGKSPRPALGAWRSVAMSLARNGRDAFRVRRARSRS